MQPEELGLWQVCEGHEQSSGCGTPAKHMVSPQDAPQKEKSADADTTTTACYCQGAAWCLLLNQLSIGKQSMRHPAHRLQLRLPAHDRQSPEVFSSWSGAATTTKHWQRQASKCLWKPQEMIPLHLTHTLEINQPLDDSNVILATAN